MEIYIWKSAGGEYDYEETYREAAAERQKAKTVKRWRSGSQGLRVRGMQEVFLV